MLEQPRISVNKLAEYMGSKAARQRKIIHDRKYPDEDFNFGMYHREASEAVSRYLAGGAFDPTPLDRQIASLSQLTPEKVGTARRINANIDALERFSNMLDDIDFLGAEATLGEHAPEKLTYHNVEISVRPEIILRGIGPKGRRLVGAVKVHFSKSSPMNEDSAGYVSAIVQEFCRRHVADDDEVVFPAYCQVIDVASGRVFEGVKSIKRRMVDVAAECQNIAALWPTI